MNDTARTALLEIGMIDDAVARMKALRAWSDRWLVTLASIGYIEEFEIISSDDVNDLKGRFAALQMRALEETLLKEGRERGVLHATSGPLKPPLRGLEIRVEVTMVKYK